MTTSSDDILAGLLAECSDSILAGATVEACLDRHPQHAAALEPLLTTLVHVHELRAVPVRSSATAARTREQFMAAAMRLAEERRTPPVTWWERLAAWWAGIVALFVPRTGSRTPGMPVGLLAAMLVVILAGVLVTGGVTVSAKSLPGDLLYPIKTSSERVRLFIVRDPMVRSGLEQEFSARRRHEAQAVAEQGRRVNSLPLDGTLEAINDNHWTVSGLDLTLDPAVQIIGDPVVGARVHGVLRAPGDGRLIVIYVEVEAPAGSGAPAPAATPPTATPTRPTATATATATTPPRSMNSAASAGRGARSARPTLARAGRLGARRTHCNRHPNPSANGNKNATANGYACSATYSNPGAHTHRHAAAQGAALHDTESRAGSKASKAANGSSTASAVNVNGATQIIGDPDRRLQSERIGRGRSRRLLTALQINSPGATGGDALNRWSSPTSSRR